MNACSCSWAYDDSFSKTVRHSDFVALVQIISFDAYLERQFDLEEKKIPSAITVEIIKKYKGEESRKTIRIYGDNGMLCRPYLSEFQLNGYYLIAPSPLDETPDTDYDFFACLTDYLPVDSNTQKAYGKYSWLRSSISLDAFERKTENGDWDWLKLVGIITLILLILIRRRMANKTST